MAPRKKPTQPVATLAELNSEVRQAAADLDRSALPAKLRAYQLAKQLGVTSHEVVAWLADIGMTKKPQSTLTPAEVGQLLDELAPVAPAAPSAPVATAEEVAIDRLRHQVEKGVANEINQIEQKVEKELEERAAEEAEKTEAAAEEIHWVEPTPPLFVAPHQTEAETTEEVAEAAADTEEATPRRRRGRRGTRRGRGTPGEVAAGEQVASESSENLADAELNESDTPGEELTEPIAIKGSTRLEAQRRRRNERREEERKKRHVVSEAEFLSRRESVERTMVVRERQRSDHPGLVTQVGVLEDGMLVEHFVTSDTQNSMIGNIYLGRVQNVLPSMEAAFIDIGKGRNGVLYAGEVDWKAAGLGGRSRRIEQALRSGDQVIVQVTKDPIGHKGARLSTQISFAGRYLVYVPGGNSAGISRKLPAPERKRLKDILKRVVPRQGGAIIRTAAEGATEAAIAADVTRLHDLWEDIQVRAQEEMDSRGAQPVALYEEPDMLVKVVRDLFNEDFSALVVDGERSWRTVKAYVHSVAPDLEDRLVRFDQEANEGQDAFAAHRVDEQLYKALSRMVWLPSGGSLVIDRTEAMTVIDVNTGKFTGSGGNLEETVTKNNLEAAEEIVRQLRLRDVGGMIVIDFIDMVLPENRELVLRRLKEALGRDRTRHQVSEVTSLGLVQLTRKRLGTGLLETFATTCECCEGRGIILHEDPIEPDDLAETYAQADQSRRERRTKAEQAEQEQRAERVEKLKRHEAELAEIAATVVKEDPEPEAEAAAEETRVERPRRSRRGTRRSNRPAPTPAVEPELSELEQIVSAAVDKADDHDPDEPSGADYERAVAEFEASPRRRRATRGNSRSDRRPRREDFISAEPEPSVVVEHAELATQPGTSEGAFGRRHRRAIRRRVGQRPVAQAPEPPVMAEEPKATEPATTLRRTRRRRATRRAGGSSA